jgi:putative ABC transport system substrate-binding protein
LEIVGKRLELLKEVVPQASRVAVLWNPGDPDQPFALEESRAKARALRLQLQVLEARTPDAFERAFEAMTRERAQALFVLKDPMFLIHRTRLAALAAQHRLPTSFDLREFVEVGGLMAYAVNMAHFVGRAAVYVDKILKGAKPGDLPVEQPTKFELVINLRTAKALGLTVPQSVLIRADEVIQ